MTCIVMFAGDDGVLALSDTACISMRGEIMCFMDKVEMHPTRHMCIAQSGQAGFLPALWVVLGNEISSLDDFEAAFPAAASYVYRHMMLQTGGNVLEVGLAVGGWSARRNGYTLLCTSSYEKTSRNLETDEITVREPFSFIEGGMWMSGNPDPDDLRAVGLDPDDIRGEMDRRDRLDFGTRLVFAKRRSSGPREPSAESSAPYYLCGGSIVMSRLWDGGASQQVLYRWKDQVGDTVDLSQDEPPPKFSFGNVEDTPVETAEQP